MAAPQNTFTYMKSSYPPMSQSEWDRAPFNQSNLDNMEFEVTCSQSLSKTVTVVTDNYMPGASGVDYEPDGEGGYYAIAYHDSPDTSDTNWAEEYHENDYHTPAQLLTLFKQFLEENKEHGLVFKSPGFTDKLIEECSGWTEDDTEYIKE